MQLLTPKASESVLPISFALADIKILRGILNIGTRRMPMYVIFPRSLTIFKSFFVKVSLASASDLKSPKCHIQCLTSLG
jgi:hypothetical protein